jgi:hypothetical protein
VEKWICTCQGCNRAKKVERQIILEHINYLLLNKDHPWNCEINHYGSCTCMFSDIIKFIQERK